MNDTPAPQNALPDRLSLAELDLLTQVYTLLMAHLPAGRNSDEFIELGRAVHAGATSARSVIRRYGVATMAEKLRLSAQTLRGTGYFADAVQVETLADNMISWSRRASGERRRADG